jgi:hypothetical protein
LMKQSPLNYAKAIKTPLLVVQGVLVGAGGPKATPPLSLQVKVTGTESVTVPAGTFDSYKVEISSAEGGPEKVEMFVDCPGKPQAGEVSTGSISSGRREADL